MLRSLVLLAAFVASGPALAQVIVGNGYPADAPLTFEEVHRRLTPDLENPESAQYKDFVVATNPVGPVVCGLVRWKRPTGDYGQFEPFSVAVNDPDAGVAKDYKVSNLVRYGFSFTGCVDAMKLQPPTN